MSNCKFIVKYIEKGEGKQFLIPSSLTDKTAGDISKDGLLKHLSESLSEISKEKIGELSTTLNGLDSEVAMTIYRYGEGKSLVANTTSNQLLRMVNKVEGDSFITDIKEEVTALLQRLIEVGLEPKVLILGDVDTPILLKVDGTSDVKGALLDNEFVIVNTNNGKFDSDALLDLYHELLHIYFRYHPEHLSEKVLENVSEIFTNPTAKEVRDPSGTTLSRKEALKQLMQFGIRPDVFSRENRTRVEKLYPRTLLSKEDHPNPTIMDKRIWTEFNNIVSNNIKLKRNKYDYNFSHRQSIDSPNQLFSLNPGDIILVPGIKVFNKDNTYDNPYLPVTKVYLNSEGETVVSVIYNNKIIPVTYSELLELKYKTKSEIYYRKFQGIEKSIKSNPEEIKQIREKFESDLTEGKYIEEGTNSNGTTYKYSNSNGVKIDVTSTSAFEIAQDLKPGDIIKTDLLKDKYYPVLKVYGNFVEVVINSIQSKVVNISDINTIIFTETSGHKELIDLYNIFNDPNPIHPYTDSKFFEHISLKDGSWDISYVGSYRDVIENRKKLFKRLRQGDVISVTNETGSKDLLVVGVNEDNIYVVSKNSESEIDLSTKEYYNPTVSILSLNSEFGNYITDIYLNLEDSKNLIYASDLDTVEFDSNGYPFNAITNSHTQYECINVNNSNKDYVTNNLMRGDIVQFNQFGRVFKGVINKSDSKSGFFEVVGIYKDSTQNDGKVFRKVISPNEIRGIGYRISRDLNHNIPGRLQHKIEVALEKEYKPYTEFRNISDIWNVLKPEDVISFTIDGEIGSYDNMMIKSINNDFIELVPTIGGARDFNNPFKLYIPRKDFEFNVKVTRFLIPSKQFDARTREINIHKADSKSQEEEEISNVSASLQQDRLTLNKIINNIQDIYPQIELVVINNDFFNSEEYVKDFNNIDVDRFKSKGAFLFNNRIYINSDIASINAPVHELLHVVMGVIRASNPVLYNELLESCKEFPLFKDNLSKLNADRPLNMLMEEAFVDTVSSIVTGVFTKNLEKEYLISSGLNEIIFNTLTDILQLDVNNSITALNGVKSIANYIGDNPNVTIFDIIAQFKSSLLQPQTVFNPVNLLTAMKNRQIDNIKQGLMSKGLLTEECI